MAHLDPCQPCCLRNALKGLYDVWCLISKTVRNESADETKVMVVGKLKKGFFAIKIIWSRVLKTSDWVEGSLSNKIKTPIPLTSVDVVQPEIWPMPKYKTLERPENVYSSMVLIQAERWSALKIQIHICNAGRIMSKNPGGCASPECSNCQSHFGTWWTYALKNIPLRGYSLNCKMLQCNRMWQIERIHEGSYCTLGEEKGGSEKTKRNYEGTLTGKMLKNMTICSL